ncbi:MAG: zinc ribbon domain-containing protein [Oscillospiraceae bacterium]|jgi:ribosomal protein L32|nr:zinc ribbon domain-containing protein [Oscillospiraceae bacterium]
MGFLDRAIRRGVSSAIGSAVSQGVSQAIGSKVQDTAADLTQRAADAIAPTVNQAAAQTAAPASAAASSLNSEETKAALGTLGGLFGSFAQQAESYANEAAKNMKLCPSCGEAAEASQKFCPSCGTKLPELTLAQGAVCASCGAQNKVGTKFCAECGAKLPQAEAEEQAAAAKAQAVLDTWAQKLPYFPPWNGGGKNLDIEDGGLDENGHPFFYFRAEGVGVQQLAGYRALLQQSGFRPAGKYPSADYLYTRAPDGQVYCFDSGEAFSGGSGYLAVGFCQREPQGGFDYVKPAPAPKSDNPLDDLKKGLSDVRGLFKF